MCQEKSTLIQRSLVSCQNTDSQWIMKLKKGSKGPKNSDDFPTLNQGLGRPQVIDIESAKQISRPGQLRHQKVDTWIPIYDHPGIWSTNSQEETESLNSGSFGQKTKEGHKKQQNITKTTPNFVMLSRVIKHRIKPSHVFLSTPTKCSQKTGLLVE